MNSKDAVYCVILTKYRLLQGLALYRSLQRNAAASKVYFLCVDSETYEILAGMGLTDAVLVRLEEVENNELLKVKAERKLNEYCWTLKPYFLEYLLCLNNVRRITYLDADLYFFNNPEKIFDDAPYCPVILTKHDYPVTLDQMSATCGKYNSGFISIVKCQSGIECIRWWKQRCFKWCSEVPENGRFGDQKYLDSMPFFFKKVCCSRTPGVNIAPWNHINYSFSERDGKIYVDDKPLIFYHFSGLRLLNGETAALTMHFEKDIIPMVYGPYLHELQSLAAEVNAVNPGFQSFYIEDERKNGATIIRINEI